jgi:hypothetical protein
MRIKNKLKTNNKEKYKNIDIEQLKVEGSNR